MNAKKYTIGPWMFFDDGNGLTICPKSCDEDLLPHVSAARNRIAKVPILEGYEFDSLWPIMKANAALLATSPEMFELLKSYQQHEKHSKTCPCKLCVIILKAEGVNK